jgi:phosphate transport system permease protein
VHAMTIKEKRGLMGSGAPVVDRTFNLTADLKGKPAQILSSAVGDGLLVADETGEVDYYFLQTSGDLELRQKFKPFSDLKDPKLSSMGYVFGDVSVVVTSVDGHQRVFSLYNQPIEKDGETLEMRLYGQTKTFPDLKQGATFFAAGQRNKTFLTGHGKFASLRYVTTEDVRWEEELPFEISRAVIDAKTENIIFLDTAGTLHRYSLHDPHPEAGWKAFFGKVWYEGAKKPEYTWQSTSGTDDFEAKLSLMPLIVGSLKGTFYALLFAVPIALLAAVYSACYLPPSIKRVLKPTMEIMASLPSVVLGFLAGLWLAPLLEDKVPSVLLTIISLPIGAMLCGWAWTKLPVHLRSRVKLGNEYLLVLVPVVLVGYAAWSMGPVLEQWLFVVQDPATGQSVADFRMWWPHATNTPFDVRNSMVVGFMMGFAVIPIIFTISEDALSNVPAALKGASMALGANRWQVVRTIVLPIAAAGIFSALMIGFGRAVGETMIVVMATGNTPVMDMNIFSGMRTLSANIAVELPEAAQHSTHYRTLFLGAMVLFVLTFALNTTAELMRQHLREKFKLV